MLSHQPAELLHLFDGDRPMAKESGFVDVAENVANEILKPPMLVKRGAALLYQVTVDNKLETTVDVKHPVRGNSAFQTDLCIFEEKSKGVFIPRVVLEFKTRISTHDVLTYSAKATKHKQVYPYLRYGIVASAEASVPGRLFTHNESLDFCACVGGMDDDQFGEIFADLLTSEVKSSKRLEKLAYGSFRTRLFRNEVFLLA
jgi:hypothetical protein